MKPGNLVAEGPAHWSELFPLPAGHQLYSASVAMELVYSAISAQSAMDFNLCEHAELLSLS